MKCFKRETLLNNAINYVSDFCVTWKPLGNDLYTRLAFI